LQAPIIDLFLCFLCQRDHRALQEIDGERLDVKIGMSPTIRIRLQRGKLVGAAEWHRLRDLGNHLFGISRPPANRSLQGQDRFATALKEQGQAKRTVLQGLHERLIHLGVEQGARLAEIASANSRLAALALSTTDSHKVVTELLAAWPDDASDPLRSVVQQAEALRDALGELNEHARSSLQAGVSHPSVGAEAAEHLSSLSGRLCAAQAELPFDGPWVQDWSKKAQVLIHQLIARPQVVDAPVIQAPKAGEQPKPSARAVLANARINPKDAQAVSDFLEQVRRAVAQQSGKSIHLVVLREEDSK
jgi:hypothetical protein